jgi:ribbon-helix-helix CopG family protein
MTVRQTVRGADDMAAEGTPFRRIRMDDDLWERLDEAVKRADPDDNRSALIRRLARWYVGDIDEIPRRPEPRRADQDTTGHRQN